MSDSSSEKRKYSVLLHYSDSDELDDFRAPETFYSFVEAEDPGAAVAAARARLIQENGYEPEENGWTEEDLEELFPPLLVVDGWALDLRGALNPPQGVSHKT